MAKQLIDLNNILGFNLPAQEKAIVIHDPAAVEMYPRLRAAVSLYREMGHAIIKTAYASYLYQTMGPWPGIRNVSNTPWLCGTYRWRTNV